MLTLFASTALAGTFNDESINNALIAELVRAQDADDLVGWSDCSSDEAGCVSLDVETSDGVRTWVLTDETCSDSLSEGCYNGHALLGGLDHTLTTMALDPMEISLETDIWVWEAGVAKNTGSVSYTMTDTGEGMEVEIAFTNHSLQISALFTNIISPGAFSGANSTLDCFEIWNDIQRILQDTDIQDLQGALEGAGVNFTGLTHDGSFSLWGTVKQNPNLLTDGWRARLWKTLNRQFQDCIDTYPPNLPDPELPDFDFEMMDEVCMECTKFGTEDYSFEGRRPDDSMDDGWFDWQVNVTEQVCLEWEISLGEDYNGDGFCD